MFLIRTSERGCARRRNGNESGYAALVAVVFVILMAIAAQNVAEDARTLVRHGNEERLRAHLVEYNMAVLRFRVENGRFPSSIDELQKFPGGLRRIYADPFTKKKDYTMAGGAANAAEKGEKFFIVSASSEKSLGGIEYSRLTADIAGAFRPVEKITPAEATGYEYDRKINK